MRPITVYSMLSLGVLLLSLGACSERESVTRLSAPEESGLVSGASQEDYMFTPSGWWYHRSCVHAIEEGARVDRKHEVTRRDGTKYQIPKCSYPVYRSRPGSKVTAPTDEGWMEWAYLNAPVGGWFSQINANWTVPTAPQGSYGSGQVFYTFPGIQSDSFILQPVLQYGANAYFGGSYWTMASWQCDGPNGFCAYSSPVLRVSPNDALSGTVAAHACSNGVCTWTVTSIDVTTVQSTTYTASDTSNYFYGVGGSVEVHGLTSCNQYPDNGVFYTGITLYDQDGNKLTPSWSGTTQSNPNPSCSFSVTTTASTVNLNLPPALVASWTGPVYEVGHDDYCSWTATVSSGTPPYSYNWHASWSSPSTGFYFTSGQGTPNATSFGYNYNSYPDHAPINVYLDVADAFGKSYSLQRTINLYNYPLGCY